MKTVLWSYVSDPCENAEIWGFGEAEIALTHLLFTAFVFIFGFHHTRYIWSETEAEAEVAAATALALKPWPGSTW